MQATTATLRAGGMGRSPLSNDSAKDFDFEHFVDLGQPES